MVNYCFLSKCFKNQGILKKNMATITAILFCALSMFVGSVCITAMGFGSGICYLFIYQIGSMAGLEECCGLPDLKYEVMLQFLGLATISPVLLWGTGLRENFSWLIFLVLVPICLVVGPVGQFLQGYTPVPILRIIIGVATLFVAIWQLFAIYRMVRGAPKQKDVIEEDGTVISNPVVKVTNIQEISPSKTEDLNNYAMMKTEDPLSVGQDQPSDKQVKQHQDLRRTEENEANVDSPCEGSGRKEKFAICCVNLKSELWPIRPEITFMFLAGLTGGLLGGLVGAGGPPVILFFFIYDYKKEVVRATGAFLAFTISVVLLISYIVKSPPPERGTATWFVREDMWLYVAVMAAGLVGCPLGIYLSRFLNKWAYKAGLCAVLILNGISMIITASISLSA